jgi:CelD/BcsL family acetyltransferase involved in cellulose biosynthesis
LTETAGPWRETEVALTFRLGEIKVASKSLRGFANRRHFTRTNAFKGLPDPEQESAPEANFYFYPTYPIAFEPARIARSGDWLIYTPYAFDNYYVDLAAIGSFEAYLKLFSSRSRSTLLRKVRKFEEAGGGALNWRVFSARSEMSEFFALALPLSGTTYQSRLLGSGLPESKEFREHVERVAERGGVRGFLLFLKDKPVAYVVCFVSDGIVTYDYVGYASSESALSPGTVLQFLVLKALFADPSCSIFDFTEGEGAQKKFFGTASQRCAKSYFLRRSLRNAVLIRAHKGLNDFVEAVGRLLDRLGIKAAVRRLVRRVG